MSTQSDNELDGVGFPDRYDLWAALMEETRLSFLLRFPVDHGIERAACRICYESWPNPSRHHNCTAGSPRLTL